MCADANGVGPLAARRDRRGGFTLIEVLSSTLLIAAVLAAAMHASIDMASGNEVVRAGLFVRVDHAMARIGDDLGRGDLDPIPAAGDSLSFEVPVDPDGDGSFLDASGQIQWGSLVNGVATAGARTTLQFVTDRVVSEATQGVDLNGDGDKKDRFDLGHLELVRSDGTREPLTGAWILQPNLHHGGDIDGDGVADPIFSADTSGQKTTALIDLTVAVKLTEQKWVVERKQKTILCQNDVH